MVFVNTYIYKEISNVRAKKSQEIYIFDHITLLFHFFIYLLEQVLLTFVGIFSFFWRLPIMMLVFGYHVLVMISPAFHEVIEIWDVKI